MFNSMQLINVYEDCVVINNKKPYTLLIFKDSFSAKLSTFLNQSFGKVVYCNYGHDKSKELTQLVEKYRPDFVIYEIVERALFSRQELHPNIVLKSILNPDTLLFERGDFLYKNVKNYFNFSEVKLNGNDLILHSVTIDPYLYLPPVLNDKNKNLIVKIKMSSDKESFSQLFYISNNDSFNEKQSVRQKLLKGENEIVFLVPGKNINGKMLRFDPSSVAGEYNIHSIEIFGVDCMEN